MHILPKAQESLGTLNSNFIEMDFFVITIVTSKPYIIKWPFRLSHRLINE